MAELPAGYARVEGTTRVPVPGATRVGPANPDERLTVSVRLRRRLGAPPLPDLSQGALPSGRHLSREEFAAVYGADPADIERITEFASAHGLSVEETSVPRRTVVLCGTVTQMQEAFQVDLGRWEVGETSYRGREGDVHVPVELAPLVEGVFGLDNRQQVRPAISQVTGSAEPAQAVAALTPPQVAQLYNFPAGNAAGQCIGLIEFAGGYQSSDITTWFENLNPPLTPPALTVVSVDGGQNTMTQNFEIDGEVLIDICVAGSVAQGASIAVYFAPNTSQGCIDAFSRAVLDTVNKPSVISCSWGGPEDSTWADQAITQVSASLAEAAVLGITVFVASGDLGSDCNVKDGHAHVVYPASDPGVTACGGTAVQNVNQQSFTEVLWNDADGASGGGVSAKFSVPAWQSGANVPASVNDGTIRGRGVPDVAGNAAPTTGYYLTYNGATTTTPVAGTSAVAPLYAGLIARINAARPSSAGYLNPALYQRRGAGTFRDTTAAGTNGFNNAPGYPVGPGWDATTGFGSINGMCLVASLWPQLWHTIQIPSGNWSGFGLVENQELNSPGTFTAISCAGISCAGVDSQLQFIGMANGQLWNTIRWDSGMWQPNFEPIPSQDNPGAFTAISCAGVGPACYFAGIVGGQLWGTIRWNDGTWIPDFQPIPAQDNLGPFTAISCAGVGTQLPAQFYVAGIVNGQAWYTVQNFDGSFPAFQQIPAQDNPGPFTAISCAGIGTQFYVAGIVNGQPWYTVQNPDGSIPDFQQIPAQDNPGPFTAISCAGVGTQFYVAGIVNGQLWYTVRSPDGSWKPFGLIEGQQQNSPGPFTAISCAGVGSIFQVVGLTPR